MALIGKVNSLKTTTLPIYMALASFCFSSMLPALAKTQIWFGGVDTITAPTVLESKSTDYSQLFEIGSPWQRAASHLDVFKISTQFAISSSARDISAMVAFLRQKNIALAIEMGMLRADRGCGRGEGYMPKETLQLAMKRLKNLGADLRYVVADEVVYFGRYNNNPPNKMLPCHDSVYEIAREVAETVSEINQYFPNAEFGYAEPIGGQIDRLGRPVPIDQNAAISDYLKFADLYQDITGRKIAFFQADVAWRTRGWQQFLAKLKGGVQSRGIRFGIIIGGNPDFTDDLSWTGAGLKLLQNLYNNPATSPGYVIIQSWQPHPTRYLPEKQPGTGTWMLLNAEDIAAKNERMK